jgi:hypothetical protein
LLYIEYVSRRAGISIDEFHEGALRGQEGWESEMGSDELVLNVGRTWRLGPEPEYFSIWRCDDLGRIDEWDKMFRAGNADPFQDPFGRVARIDVAGCYEELAPPVRTRGRNYYTEFFEVPSEDGLSEEQRRDLLNWFRGRFAEHEGFPPLVLAARLGQLAPEPGGLAVWSIPDFASLSHTLSRREAPLRIVSAGVYADVGREIL